MREEIEQKWKELLERLSKEYGETLDMQAILFLIGVQELGQGHRKFSKDQKIDLIHVATCTLLSPWGYYEYEGKDKDGWPHWKTTSKLPPLKPGQQLQLMKEAILEYFN
jgi:hypothetical protein